MRKVLITTLLLFSIDAMAQWSLIDWGDGVNTYLDNKSIRKKRAIVKAWTMMDYEVPRDTYDGIKFSSHKALYVLNCEEETANITAYAMYEGRMGEGNLIRSGDMHVTNPTDSVIPGTKVALIFTKACGK